MQFKDLTKDEINQIYSNIDKYLEAKEIKWTKYIDLGCKIVKLISYSDEFLPLVEKQLTYVLKDKSDHFDDTLVIWNEKDPLKVIKDIFTKFSKMEMRLRLEKAFRKAHGFEINNEKELYNTQIFEKSFSKTKPAIDFQTSRGFIIGNNKENHTYYYGVNNLEPEEFIKEGHIFVQIFNNILKTETSNLVHGAVIGYNGNGICFCARGQRGKSTLSVLSMMKGFEYVSDDYLILHKDSKGQLLSSPIYSIITLSPEMYNRLYNYMNNSRFISNNARKDKYVFNISNYHNTFKKNYPIKLCIFPEIVTDKDPSIRPCTIEEKGRAIVQIIQSTLMQTADLSENWTVKKLMNMVKDLPFYKLNLCWDIDRNTEFLREFMNNFNTLENTIIETPKIAIDITFDLANILNTEIGIIYSMNKFATNIYENLLRGVSNNKIKIELEKYLTYNKNILFEFESLVVALKEKEILTQVNLNESLNVEINEEFAKEDKFKLSFIEHAEEKYIELIKGE
ncbi:MAG: hypothetical protein ACI4S3_04840 [Candidatus Gastranaerophilaceae bacterium]